MHTPPEWGVVSATRSSRYWAQVHPEDSHGVKVHRMRTEFINPFLQAANEVLEAELGTTPRRGTIGLEKSVNTSNDITAVVGVTGDVLGVVLYVMNEATGRALVTKIMGQEFPEFDDLAQSGIAE